MSRVTRARANKKPEDLMEDVEAMADKAGVKMPKDDKTKKEEVKEAVANSRDKPYKEYSKQAALEELKEKHEVTKPKGKGDPYSLAPHKSARQKRGINAEPSEEEKQKPPTKRKTPAGNESAMNKVVNEENRPLADALYELADFVLKGDSTQKGISYQKAAKSVREAPEPIKTRKEAEKLVGVGKKTGEKIGQFLDEGKIDVLEEYRSGERGM